MASLFDMPPLGVGFQPYQNGLLGLGDVRLARKLGGLNDGLARTLTQLSGGTDVINAMALSLPANPQAVMVLTGTTGNTVQPAGTIGVAPPGGGGGIANPVQGNAANRISRQ